MSSQDRSRTLVHLYKNRQISPKSAARCTSKIPGIRFHQCQCSPPDHQLIPMPFTGESWWTSKNIGKNRTYSPRLDNCSEFAVKAIRQKLWIFGFPKHSYKQETADMDSHGNGYLTGSKKNIEGLLSHARHLNHTGQCRAEKASMLKPSADSTSVVVIRPYH